MRARADAASRPRGRPPADRGHSTGRLTPRMATAGGTSGEAADAAAAGRAVLSSRATKPSQGTAAERAASDSVAAGRLRGRPWILDSAYGLVTTGTRARTRSRIPPHA